MDRPLRETDWIQYEIADRLNQVDTDPEDRPFLSKYEARDIWTLLRAKIMKFLENDGGDDESTTTEENRSKSLIGDTERMICESAIATLSYEIARNFASTEERPSAESTANEALERLDRIVGVEKNDGLDYELISARIALRNTLGCIYCERNDTESAISCLRVADRSYADFMATTDKVEEKRSTTTTPWELKRAVRWTCGELDDINDRYSTTNEEDEWNSFEQLHTYTLYYLAQAYKQNGEHELAAKYCQETLVRQLKSSSYNPIEWSLNTATLAVYYMDKANRKAFFRARRCLAAADTLLAKSTTPSAIEEKRRQTTADIDRCWAKYGLAVMDESHQRLMRMEEEAKQCDEDAIEKKTTSSDDEAIGGEQGFDDIPPADDFPAYLPSIEEMEKEITADFVDTYASARAVFLQVQRRIAAAHSYYTLEDHATDYTELVQDFSRSFKALAAFEADIDRKCKMHKRRIDALDAVYKELSPTYYLAIRRQIAFELGEIYNEMLDLKIEIVDELDGGNPNGHQIAKINMLARTGVKYFREFLHSFEKAPDESSTSKDGVAGESAASSTKYDTIDVRPIVLARFYIARFTNKLLTSDMREKLRNCDASLQEYRWVVDYIDRVHPEAMDTVKSEYEVSKDMVSLLPKKMDRMRITMA